MAVASTFIDNGETWAIADVLQRWTSGTVTSKPTNDFSQATVGVPNSLNKLPNATAQIGYLLIARLKVTSPPGSSVPLMRFRHGANAICELRVNSSLQMSIATNGTQIIVPDTVTPLILNTYAVVEFGVLVDSTAGRVEVKKDGIQIPTLTSIALGGTASNSLNTKPGSDTTIDTIELCTGGTPGAVFDFVVARSATAIWTGTDWYASSLVVPALKKFTTQLIAGHAGDGIYNLQVPPTQWTIGSAGPGPSHSDALRELPFTGDASYLNDSAALGNSQDTDTLKLQQSPADVGSLKLVAVVSQIRTTVTLGSQSKAYMYDPNIAGGSGGNYTDVIYADSTTVYVHRLWMLDKHPDGATSWSKAVYDGPLGSPRQIGLQMVSPP